MNFREVLRLFSPEIGGEPLRLALKGIGITAFAAALGFAGSAANIKIITVIGIGVFVIGWLVAAAGITAGWVSTPGTVKAGVQRTSQLGRVSSGELRTLLFDPSSRRRNRRSFQLALAGTLVFTFGAIVAIGAWLSDYNGASLLAWLMAAIGSVLGFAGIKSARDTIIATKSGQK